MRARVNGALAQDFVVDTGSENTVITRPTALRLGILPITQTLSAGVGDVGLRGLQLGRIDTLEIGDLKLRNVPCLIKNPPLRDVPIRETESLVAARARLLDDDRLQDAADHVRQASAASSRPTSSCRCGCTGWRPCRARSTARTGQLHRRHGRRGHLDQSGELPTPRQGTGTGEIALRVFGTSGWDRDAFLLPGVNLAFDAIRYQQLLGRRAESRHAERAARASRSAALSATSS